MKRKKPPPPPQPPAKQAEAREVAARLQAAVAFREVGIEKLAGLVGDGKPKSRNTVSHHLHPKPSSRPLPPKMRRTYERVLRLPTLSLDSGTPQQLVGMLTNVPQRVSEPYQAPFPASEGDVSGTVGFIRGQLEGFRRQGRTVVPVTQVEVWLAELEGAAATTPPAAAPAATTSIERVESLKQVEREAAAPSQTPRGRAG